MRTRKGLEVRARRTYESLSVAAARTGLSVDRLRRGIGSGEIGAYRSGPRILRIDPMDVDQVVRSLPGRSRHSD